MANHASSKKRIRQTKRRTGVNRNRLTRVRTTLRSVEEAIASGDQSVAETALRNAQPIIMRGAQKGIMERNTASRKISRLAKRVKAMAA